MTPVNMTISQLLAHFRNQDFTPSQLIQQILQKAESLKDDHTWIHLLSWEEIQPYLVRLEDHAIDDLPLYGIPFAIKDNIDLQGVPTTAACAAFSYTPNRSAFVVQKLIDAGAIPIGKTNLDQFATGLVGTRSPYGATRNAFNQAYISGGSSSGSAVAVAQGLVSFSLGTDTAGSGRVPAGFNNLLGMKPSRGLLSTRGVVPACKSLDCVSIFATTSVDLAVLFPLTAQYDPEDAYSRANPTTNRLATTAPAQFTFAVPQSDQLAFFGNPAYQDLFTQSVAQFEKLGGVKQEIDFSDFLRAARLLYEGPWVTERFLACESILSNQPEAMLEVTRNIIAPGKDISARNAFQAQYQLQACKQHTDAILQACDFLLTPTTGSIYTIDQVNQDPVQLNSNLGYYTNYMNLLDYAAISVAAGFTDTGLPFGVTLVANAFSDTKLLAFGHRLQQSLALRLGATGAALPKQALPEQASEEMTLVVCGAHMAGLPLNFQLAERHATFIKRCLSAPHYKMLALPGGPPHRPGMIRVEDQGYAIEVELWRMPKKHMGSFLQGIPQPLGLGKVELDDGSWHTGFICEGYIEAEATDISHLGGWRHFINGGA